MSAFICGPDHFKLLAIFAASDGNFGINVDPQRFKEFPPAVQQSSGVQLANVYADILYRENVRSVQTRYPNDRRDELPGPVDDPGHVTITARDFCNPALMLRAVGAAGLLKMCDCLEYQSCETEDWNQTIAYKLLERIRSAAIYQLPGYADGPWDYYADEYKPKSRKAA